MRCVVGWEDERRFVRMWWVWREHDFLGGVVGEVRSMD